MKNGVVIAISVGLVVVIVSVAVVLSGRQEHDSKDLSYWLLAGAAKDWSSEAARGEPRAQFHSGVALIRTNLVTMIDQVPRLCSIPLIGRRFFEKISYDLDGNINQEQLAEAYQWIKKSADQGFPPAKEAERLFVGKVGNLNQGNAGNGNSPGIH